MVNYATMFIRIDRGEIMDKNLMEACVEAASTTGIDAERIYRHIQEKYIKNNKTWSQSTVTHAAMKMKKKEGK